MYDVEYPGLPPFCGMDKQGESCENATLTSVPTVLYYIASGFGVSVTQLGGCGQVKMTG